MRLMLQLQRLAQRLGRALRDGAEKAHNLPQVAGVLLIVAVAGAGLEHFPDRLNL